MIIWKPLQEVSKSGIDSSVGPWGIWHHGSHGKKIDSKKNYSDYWSFFLTRDFDYACRYGKYIYTIKSGSRIIFNFRRKYHLAKLIANLDTFAFLNTIDEYGIQPSYKKVEDYLGSGKTQFYQLPATLSALRKANFKGYFNWEDTDLINRTVFDYSILQSRGIKIH
jgi:hypothetical protein